MGLPVWDITKYSVWEHTPMKFRTKKVLVAMWKTGYRNQVVEEEIKKSGSVILNFNIQ